MSKVVTPSNLIGLDPLKGSNILYHWTSQTTAPARLAGDVTLVYETIDQMKEPRTAWMYAEGQRRVLLVPQVGYDNAGTADDGTRTADGLDMFNGAPDRVDWKLVGKKEMYVPYNNYRLQSPDLRYTDIFKAGHIDQNLARYELHRVWVIESTLNPTARHIYSRRTFHIDEDSRNIDERDM